MSSNDRVGVTVAQPATQEARNLVASQCCQALNLSMPLLVDTIDDQVNRAYSGFPDRLYLIDREGKVAYKGGRGPFGYKPRELEQTLLLMLLDEALRGQTGTPVASPTSPEDGNASRPTPPDETTPPEDLPDRE